MCRNDVLALSMPILSQVLILLILPGVLLLRVMMLPSVKSLQNIIAHFAQGNGYVSLLLVHCIYSCGVGSIWCFFWRILS